MSESPKASIPTDLAERYELVRAHAVAFRPDQAKYAASKLPPRHAAHPYSLAIRGLLEWSAHRFPSAVAAFRQAVALLPADRTLRTDLAEMLWASGDQPASAAELHALHELNPADRAVISLLADRLHRMNLSHLAYAYARKLIDLEPYSADSQFILAYRAADLRRYDESLRHFTTAGTLLPADDRFGQGRFFVMLYAGTDPLELRRASESWCAAAYAHIPEGKPNPSRGNRIRIGVVSADLRNHVVASFFEGVLREYDHAVAHFEIFSNTDMPDHVTTRIAATVDAFHNIHPLSDDAATELIRSRNIDVLIDLAGHTGGSRLGIFARRAAPVQATYLGYPATTGLPQMDYRITDAIADPPPDYPGRADEHCTEKLIRLPRCAWAFSLDGSLPAPADLGPGPSARGGPLTFGSFNLLTKVNQASVSLWARALAASPGSKLLMTDRRALLADPDAVQLLRDEFVRGHADLNHVMLANWLPKTEDQRSRLSHIDLMLDPLSYNGTTTTCEALWYGIPTLTLPGASHVSRVGASLLTAIGLKNFIATSEADFISKSAALVADPTALHTLRSTLHARYRASPLHDFKSLAAALVTACNQMLDAHRR